MKFRPWSDMKIFYGMKRLFLFSVVVCFLMSVASCEILDNDINKHVKDDDSTYIGLNEVVEILSRIPIEVEHLREVHQAVTSSSGNGYDEEYMMADLFANPGNGVGDKSSQSKSSWSNPLRDLIRSHVRSLENGSRAVWESPLDADTFLNALSQSDIQIYWPFSEEWDGVCLPVITFDPEDGTDTNIGYALSVNDDGTRSVETVIVDEQTSRMRPVWVVNRNSDAGYMSLEMLRRENPSWGEGGGDLVVRPQPLVRTGNPLRTVVLKDFTMHRNYDSWFAGASEFFVKVGSLDDFTASTEAELKLYNPLITDFMVVVRRSEVGKPQPFNAVLVSDWSSQMTHCAFMITEDDGGTRTEWKCTALVRIASKSYGVEINLPFNSRDDVVWRGQLSSRWIEENNDIVGHFGDVDLTFEVLEY